MRPLYSVTHMSIWFKLLIQRLNLCGGQPYSSFNCVFLNIPKKFIKIHDMMISTSPWDFPKHTVITEHNIRIIRRRTV